MLWESVQRKKIVEDQFTTVGTVEQLPLTTKRIVLPDACMGTVQGTEDYYGQWLTAEDLLFDGVEYIAGPENRPNYFSYIPDMTTGELSTTTEYGHIVEVTPLEDSDWEDDPIEVKVTKILYSNPIP